MSEVEVKSTHLSHCELCGENARMVEEVQSDTGYRYDYRIRCKACGVYTDWQYFWHRAMTEWDKIVEAAKDEKEPHDPVNKPKHYADGAIECIDVIEQQEMPFHVANVQKYIWRWDKKGGVDDLKKARWYLDRFIKNLEKYE